MRGALSECVFSLWYVAQLNSWCGNCIALSQQTLHPTGEMLSASIWHDLDRYRWMSVYVQLVLVTLAKSSLESQGQPNRNLGEVFHLSVLVKMPRRTWEKLPHSLWVWLERPDRLLMFLFLLLVYTSCAKRQFFAVKTSFMHVMNFDQIHTHSSTFPYFISLFSSWCPHPYTPTPPIGEKMRSICEPTSVLISLCSCVKPQPKVP